MGITAYIQRMLIYIDRASRGLFSFAALPCPPLLFAPLLIGALGAGAGKSRVLSEGVNYRARRKPRLPERLSGAELPRNDTRQYLAK